MYHHAVDIRNRNGFVIRQAVYVFAILTAIGMSRLTPMFDSRQTDAQIESSTSHKARGRAAVISVDKPSGVELVARAQEDMFPEDWADPDAPTTATTPNPTLVPYAIAGIQRALRKYPAGFLKRNLKRVYIVNNLMVDGQPSGGVNCPELKTLYVDLDNLEVKEVASWSEETVHHEFAHLLADNNQGKISMSDWSKLNNPGFHYGGGGTEAIRQGKDGDEISARFLSQGFVEEYSMSDPNEDFATLCERLLSGDRKVQRAEAVYPVLKHKAEMVTAFYHALDPTFTQTYFKKLAPSSP